MDSRPSQQSQRRNRIIAIATGAITVTAIAFAAEYFSLPWKWLRSGVETIKVTLMCRI